METSDKHGPRMSDDLEKDTRAGHEEQRDLEPDASRIDLTQQEGVLADEEASARSEVARFLQPSAFPASGSDLAKVARGAFAPDDVVAALAGLPDATYQNVQEVWQALGGDVETRRA